MKNSVILLLVVFAPIICIAQSNYFTKEATIVFLSEDAYENIEARNNQVWSLLNINDGSIEFEAKTSKFKFDVPKMQEHFNESFIESSKYPTALFSGKIINIQSVNFNEDGTYPVTLDGTLTMHGVSKQIQIKGVVSVKNKKISASCSFGIILEDYKIQDHSGGDEEVMVTVTVDEYELLTGDPVKEKEKVVRAKASYKNSRVINAQSLETTDKGTLDFRISHRFGRVNGGAYEFFGLDESDIRLGFDYGITDRLQIGIGRSGYEKTYDGLIKYRLLWQTEASNKMPISVVLVSNMAINTMRFTGLLYERTFISRLNYTHQLIIGRKFSNQLSFQLIPTVVHRNFVYTRDEKNTVFAGGVAGRWRFVRRVAINAEYFYVLPGQLAPGFRDSFSVGFDIETGGHVFQLHFTNSPIMVEKGFITETTGDWLKGDIHFGFNISRVFPLGSKKKRKRNTKE
ncbi:MAG: DUF5777 family beta-barrel protein [Flavobacteriales bacterium]